MSKVLFYLVFFCFCLPLWAQEQYIVANGFLDHLQNKQSDLVQKLQKQLLMCESEIDDHRPLVCRTYFESELLRRLTEGVYLFSLYPGAGEEYIVRVPQSLMKEYRENQILLRETLRLGLHPIHYICESEFHHSMAQDQVIHAKKNLEDFSKKLRLDRQLRQKILSEFK